jgi:hypothetical protein
VSDRVSINRRLDVWNFRSRNLAELPFSEAPRHASLASFLRFMQ